MRHAMEEFFETRNILSIFFHISYENGRTVLEHHKERLRNMRDGATTSKVSETAEQRLVQIDQPVHPEIKGIKLVLVLKFTFFKEIVKLVQFQDLSNTILHL